MIIEVNKIRNGVQSHQIHDFNQDLRRTLGEIDKMEKKLIQSNEDSLLIIEKIHKMFKDYV